MTAFDRTIGELVHMLDVPGERIRIIITIEADGGYSISAKPKPAKRPAPFASTRSRDPNTRRLIRENGDPAWGAIDNPNWHGPRIGDPKPPADWLNNPDPPSSPDPEETP